MRVVGLFSGVGGLERGLEKAGHLTVGACEIDPAARAVLTARFPGVAVWEDVRALPTLPAKIDLIAAGFPCQDLSQVGLSAGIEGSKSGLVGHVLEILRRRRVPWLLLENVKFMLHLHRGNAMQWLTDQFAALGYRWAYRVIDTRAFGLPHRRLRVYLLASLVEDPATVLFHGRADDRWQDRVYAADAGAYGFY